VCVVEYRATFEGLVLRLYTLFSTRIDIFLHLQRDATDGLVDLMGRFPSTTCFFINAWTWGYEDMLTAIATHFGDKVSSPFGIMPFFSHKYPDPRRQV
jgi:hypothetical protein